jgi:hypothetical protein
MGWIRSMIRIVLKRRDWHCIWLKWHLEGTSSGNITRKIVQAIMRGRKK